LLRTVTLPGSVMTGGRSQPCTVVVTETAAGMSLITAVARVRNAKITFETRRHSHPAASSPAR
jgi:hypothetical protein